MAEVLTPEEIAVLKKNPDTAALGDKLEKESSKWIPRTVFNETNEEAKKYRDELARIKAEQEASGKKALEEQGKFKELAETRAKELEAAQKSLDAEKSYAEKYRAMENAKREELKKSLGDAYLSIYDAAPLEDLVKIEATLTPRQTPDGHRPGSKVEEKAWDKMTRAEREAKIEAAKSGKLK